MKESENSKNGKCDSPHRSPEQRKRQIESFENMVNIRTSVPRKSQHNEMDEYNG